MCCLCVYGLLQVHSQLYYSIKVVVCSINIIMYHAMYSMCSGFTVFVVIATLVHVYSQQLIL